ncbi:MAG: glycosyltransferase [Pseudomonadota bacterium]
MAKPDHAQFRAALEDLLGRAAEMPLGRSTLCDALMTIWLMRPDLRELYSEPIQLIIWAIGALPAEYPVLATALPELASLDALGKPAKMPPDCRPGRNEPPLSAGMLLVWQVQADWQEAFDISTSEGRSRLFWYCVFTGARGLGLAGIIGISARAYLLSPVPELKPKQEHILPVNRLLLRLWQSDRQLRSQVDLRQPAHVEALMKWMLQRKLAELVLSRLVPGDWYQKFGLVEPVPPAENRRAIAPAELQPRVPQMFGVTIYGHAYGEIGIGEDARTVARALETQGIPLEIVDIALGGNAPQGDLSLQHLVVDQPTMPIAVYCLTPMETAHAHIRRQPSFKDPSVFRIGYWPWELSRLPTAWHLADHLMDEIWASSRFTASAFSDLTTPVNYLPLPVLVPTSVYADREKFGLSATDIVFLYVFDAKSYPARKNPLAAVTAFKQAFQGVDLIGPRPHLLLKTMSGHQEPEMLSMVKREVGDDPRVSIIDARFDRDEVWQLMASADAYLSLHRSEGFGRTLVEAMLLGKPVIATNASGNADFMDHPLAHPVPATMVSVGVDNYPWAEPESCWFEPDLGAAASAISRVYRQLVKGQSERPPRSELDQANARFTAEVTGAAYAARLRQIADGIGIKTA